MRQLIFGVIFSLTLTTTANGQFESIELGFGTNYTFIGNQKGQVSNTQNPNTGFISITNDLGVEETFKGFFGFSLSSNASFALSERLKIKTGLHLDYVKFQRDTEVLSSDPTINRFGSTLGNLLLAGGGFEGLDNIEELIINQNQNIEVLGDTEKGPAHIIYLSIPITLNYWISKKFYGLAGISIANRIFSRTKGDVFRFDQNSQNFIVEEQTFTDGEGINDLQFFLSTGIGYQIKSGLTLELNYQRGLSAIFEEEAQIAGKAKFNQVNLELNYQIFKAISKN